MTIFPEETILYNTSSEKRKTYFPYTGREKNWAQWYVLVFREFFFYSFFPVSYYIVYNVYFCESISNVICLNSYTIVSDYRDRYKKEFKSSFYLARSKLVYARKLAPLLRCVKFRLKKILISHILSMNLSNMDFEWETTFQWMFILKFTSRLATHVLFKPGSNIKREITRPSFSPQFKINWAFELELCLDFINEIWNC